mgnify:CR=1 FL=1
MKLIKLLLGFVVVLVLGQAGFSSLDLRNVQFDPAIVGAGDEVDIVVEYSSSGFEGSKYIGDSDYTFGVKLLSDDDLTRKYVEVLDTFGDDLKGSVLDGILYNKVFKVKVKPDAPKGSYEFKLVGSWYKNGIATGADISEKIIMDVKREGIILDVSNILTTPTQVRPGDKFVEVNTNFENVGFKTAKSVKIELFIDSEFIDASYSNNNRVWIGKLAQDETKTVSFNLNLDDYTPYGIYDLVYKISYLDEDDNSYSKEISVPFFVKPRGFLEIESVTGSGLAGESSRLEIVVKNTGSQSAEAVDVRVLVEGSQPFEFDVRNSYVGELEAGESGKAIFNFDILSKADVKEHDFKLVIRSKGDSDEGDENIYTYSRNAKFDVVGVATNKFVWVGSAGLVLLLVVLVFRGRKK